MYHVEPCYTIDLFRESRSPYSHRPCCRPQAVQRVLEALVASVAGIPRLGTSAAGALNAGPSPSASPATCVPTTSVDEELVQRASQVSRGRLGGLWAQCLWLE